MWHAMEQRALLNVHTLFFKGRQHCCLPCAWRTTHGRPLLRPLSTCAPIEGYHTIILPGEAASSLVVHA